MCGNFCIFAPDFGLEWFDFGLEWFVEYEKTLFGIFEQRHGSSVG